jgi:hypothetical protein
MEENKFWKQRLTSFFLESNEQWLLDQFIYCKTYLFNNSFEEEFGDPDDPIWTVDKYMEDYKQAILKENNTYNNKDANDDWNQNEISFNFKVKKIDLGSIVHTWTFIYSQINNI